MFRPALTLVLAISLLTLTLSAQVEPKPRPDSDPSSRPAATSKPTQEDEAERAQRELRLDLVVPKHDKESYVKDEKTGVSWSFLHRGSDDRPLIQIGDRVRAHVTMWLAKDGTEKNSTRRREDRRPNPVSFDSGAYIRGLNVVTPFLRPGDKVRVDVPSAMAFGSAGLRDQIGPDEDLIYAIQILKIEGHVDIPAFPSFDEAKASKLKDGSAYVVLKDGEGPVAGPKAAVAFEYVIWDENGNLIDSSLFPNKPPIGAQEGGFRFEFHNIVSQITRLGGEYLARFPFEVIFPGQSMVLVDSKSKYIYFYVRTAELVPFSSPDDEKMVKDKNGLEYHVIKEGSAEKIKPEDRVHFHYIYWTYPEGELVDASYTRGISNNFKQVGLIPGMRQALSKIGVGGIIRARVPAALAWGAGGRVGVKPNSQIMLQAEVFPLADPCENPRDLDAQGKRKNPLKGNAEAKKKRKGEAKKKNAKDDDGEDDEAEDDDK